MICSPSFLCIVLVTACCGVQRIPRYGLLLRELIKNTPPEIEEHAAISEVEKIVNGVCTEINAEAGQADKRFQTLELHDRLNIAETESDDRSPQAISGGRSFLKQLVKPYRLVC